MLGVDDGPLAAGWRRDALVVGAVYRGGDVFEGLLSTRVRRDGSNVTRRLIDAITGSKFHRQLHAVLLDGVAFGGFNVVDLPRLHEALGLPVLSIMRRQPDRVGMLAALENVASADRKRRLLDRAGPIQAIPVDYQPGADGAAPSGERTKGTLYCQLHGLAVEEASTLLSVTCTRSKVPEPIRAAHLIAAGVVLGESGRRA